MERKPSSFETRPLGAPQDEGLGADAVVAVHIGYAYAAMLHRDLRRMAAESNDANKSKPWNKYVKRAFWLTLAYLAFAVVLTAQSKTCSNANAGFFVKIGNLLQCIGRVEANNLGDWLAGIFAPVALLWLATTTWIQSKELELQREELAATRAEMAASRMVSEAMAQEAKKQAEFIGVQTEILRLDGEARIEERNDKAMDVELDSIRVAIITELSGTIVEYGNGTDYLFRNAGNSPELSNLAYFRQCYNNMKRVVQAILQNAANPAAKATVWQIPSHPEFSGAAERIGNLTQEISRSKKSELLGSKILRVIEMLDACVTTAKDNDIQKLSEVIVTSPKG
jgi:hypothetical protein